MTSSDIIGTTGEALRLEAFQIQLTGAMADRYSIHYRAHVQSLGWQDWVKDGAVAGTTGRGLRVEAVQILLAPK